MHPVAPFANSLDSGYIEDRLGTKHPKWTSFGYAHQRPAKTSENHMILLRHRLFGICLILLLTGNVSAQNAVLEDARAEKVRAVIAKQVLLTDESEKQDKDDKKKEEKKADDDDALGGKGLLDQVAEPIGKLVELKWKNDHVVAEFKAERNEVYQIINEIQKIGGWGGSSSSGGTKGWSYTFYGQKISGEYRTTGKEGEQNVFKITELTENQRTLIVTGNDESFSLTINSGNSPYLLRVKQLPSRQIIVQEINGVRVESFQAENFATLVREHVEFSENRLFPALKRFGLGDLMTPYSDVVRLHVLSMLSPLTSDEAKEFKQLADKLNSRSFQEREKAMAELKAIVPQKREFFARAMNDPQFSPEVKQRIRKIMESETEMETSAALKIAAKSHLTDDVEYLSWLLQDQPAGTGRERIIQRLKSLGAEAFSKGNDSSQSWLASRAMVSCGAGQMFIKSESKSVDPFDEKGDLDKIAGGIAGLVRIKWNNDYLMIDRDHWSAPFGGKSIKELSEEVDQEIAKRSLPKKWYSGGGRYDLKYTGFPQVLFEKIEDQLVKSVVRYYSGSSQRTKGRAFDAGNLLGTLTIEGQTGSINSSVNRKSNKSNFEVVFTEKNKARRQLKVTEAVEGRVTLSYTSEGSNLILRLIKVKTGWVLQDVRGSQVFAVEGESVRKLVDDHPEYFKEQFFPLFHKLGVQFDPEVYRAPASDQPESDSDKKSSGTSASKPKSKSEKGS